jgi:hypothetical protein
MIGAHAISPGSTSGLPARDRSGSHNLEQRAWGTAWDCDAWDETVGHAFVIEHHGTQGIGPERNLAPCPSDILAFDDDGSTDPGDDEAGDGDLGEGDEPALDEDRRG